LTLSKGAVFLNLVETLADAGVVRVVDINVSSRPRGESFSFLIARPLVTAVKRNSHLHGLFHQNSAFNFVLLLLISVRGVLAWRRVIKVSLLGEGSIKLVFPEVATFGGAHERTGRVHLVARPVHRLDHGVSLTGGLAGSTRSFLILRGVMTRPREVLSRLDGSSFLAVWYSREEDGVLALSIELLLLYCEVFVLVVCSWPGVFLSGKSVMLFIFGRPELPLHVRRAEIIGQLGRLDELRLGVVHVGPDSICSSSGIRVLGCLSRRNRGNGLFWSNSHIVMYFFAVLVTSLVSCNPRFLNIISSRCWVLEVGGRMEDTRSRSSWTEALNFGFE